MALLLSRLRVIHPIAGGFLPMGCDERGGYFGMNVSISMSLEDGAMFIAVFLVLMVVLLIDRRVRVAVENYHLRRVRRSSSCRLAHDVVGHVGDIFPGSS